MSSQEMSQTAFSYICGKCGRQYRIPQIRFCPHPKTNREDGVYICYCCCQRCAFSSNDHLCGAINCDVFITNRCMQGVFLGHRRKFDLHQGTTRSSQETPQEGMGKPFNRNHAWEEI